MAKKEFLDFQKIKAEADCLLVLGRLGIFDRLRGMGNGEYAGQCPLGEADHGKKDSFSINVNEEGKFQCFACNKKGSIIDLVRYILDLDLRDSARYVRDVSTGEDDNKAMDAVSQEVRIENTDSVDDLIDEMMQSESCALVAVMTLGEALRRIKAGQLDKADVRVVDMATLRYVDTVIGNQQRARVNF